MPQPAESVPDDAATAGQGSGRATSARDRILEAATAEFAAHGIAGARVDRIARSAGTSKERVYAYFRSKQELYRLVLARELDAIAAATQLDVSDLPGYAGRVHDYFRAHPDNQRLMRWGQLELTEQGPSPAGARTISDKLDKLRQAQVDGLLDAAWDPLDVLVICNQLAMAWADQAGLVPAQEAQPEQFWAERRAAVVTSVQRLFPAAG